jgi:hypothetical protein
MTAPPFPGIRELDRKNIVWELDCAPTALVRVVLFDRLSGVIHMDRHIPLKFVSVVEALPTVVATPAGCGAARTPTTRITSAICTPGAGLGL